jgi:O-succinylbenzoic acid--CoA ligase
MLTIYLQNKALRLHDFLSEETNSSFEKNCQALMADWQQGKMEFELQTSGSTGVPKKIVFTRKQLELSAQQTIRTFDLSKKDCLMCCLSPEHTAGFMMIIRALVLEADLCLVEPRVNPFQSLQINRRIDFLALVPYQLEKILDDGKDGISQLNNIRCLIIGGGSVSEELRQRIGDLRAEVYHTYGMTETLSHVAIRDLKKNEAVFSALQGVQFRVDDEHRLLIQTPLYPGKWIQTNDIIDWMDESHFRWKARADWVINSGGIKLFPEELEKKIEADMQQIFPGQKFFFSSKEDSSLGQKLILCIEGFQDTEKERELLNKLQRELKSYEIPKEVKFIQNFAYTSIGKIDRGKTK